MTSDPISTRWAEQLAPLDEHARRAVVNALANTIHDGWNPSDEDVVRLVEFALGDLDVESYRRDVLARLQSER